MAASLGSGGGWQGCPLYNLACLRSLVAGAFITIRHVHIYALIHSSEEPAGHRGYRSWLLSLMDLALNF